MKARRLPYRLLHAAQARLAGPTGPGTSDRRQPATVWVAAPPSCPDGWSIQPPDFVGIGAQRAGTSRWFALLCQHPAVCAVPGNPKELHFFDQFWRGGTPAPEAYHRYFPRPPGQIAGEWTPRYMHDFWTPPMLRSLAPDARLLVLVRDPIERYQSGLAHELGKTDAPSPLFAAGDAFSRGLYYRQLARVLAHFDEERLLVLQHEACLVRPDVELKRTHAFLGLEPALRLPANLAERVNPSPGVKVALAPERREALKEAYREDTARLLAAFPHLDAELWPNMKDLA